MHLHRRVLVVSISNLKEKMIYAYRFLNREWRWFRGTHVPLLPGWDVTWKKAKVTFCELHITRDDLEALKFLQNTNFFNKHKGFMDLPRKQQESFYELQDQELFDFDLSNGAEILIKILEDADKEPKQRLFAGSCQEAR